MLNPVSTSGQRCRVWQTSSSATRNVLRHEPAAALKVSRATEIEGHSSVSCINRQRRETWTLCSFYFAIISRFLCCDTERTRPYARVRARNRGTTRVKVKRRSCYHLFPSEWLPFLRGLRPLSGRACASNARKCMFWPLVRTVVEVSRGWVTPRRVLSRCISAEPREKFALINSPPGECLEMISSTDLLAGWPHWWVIIILFVVFFFGKLSKIRVVRQWDFPDWIN